VTNWIAWIIAGCALSSCQTGGHGIASRPRAAEKTAVDPPPVVRGRPPKLVVQITVDQLRPDYWKRYAARYGAGGFRRFLEQGLRYESTFYSHAATETAVGHATLFTGASPADHGIVGNEWFDPVQKRRRFAVEDGAHRLLGRETPPDTGTSPAALRTTTIGDELFLATGGRSLIRSISIKDRAAIIPAGRAGKAFWFDDRTGDFVTSDFYFSAIPPFAEAFNRKRPADHYRSRAWELLLPRDGYLNKDEDDRPFELGYKTLGRVFPHPLGGDTPAFYATLKRTPFGDELTEAFVAALLEGEPLGADDVPDLLAVSFSSTDYVGHFFGPESLEAEDNMLRLDRTLARLFESLLKRVGESELLVVLSSDHGGCESPEALTKLGIAAERHDSRALVQALEQALQAKFGKGPNLVADFANPSFWFDESAIAARKLAVEDVERAAAAHLAAQRGMAYAITRTDLARGSLPAGLIYDRVRRAFDRERTGHVYVVPASGWVLATDARGLVTMHGTPWNHDAHVPLVFWGNGTVPGVLHAASDPRDIAVTLAAVLEIEPPRAASGRVLSEVLTGRK
jgi:predicted AlkP superfamily pyrophosphatase or phosphodiesterase